MADRVIKHGYVVTMDATRTVFADGAVAIRGRDIVGVGQTEKVLRDHAGAETIDAGGALVLPGLIDAHNHPVQHFNRGRPSADGTWPATSTNHPFALGGNVPLLVAFMGQPLQSHLSEEDVYTSCLAEFASMIRNGSTCFHDGGGAYPEVLAQAAIDAGLRGVVTRHTVDLGCDGSPTGMPRRSHDTDQELAAMDEFIAKWNGAGDGMIRAWADLLFGVACSDELCTGMKQVADRHGVGVGGHFAALKNEGETSMRWFGKRTLARLRDLGLFSPALLGAHMGFASDEEIGWLASDGVSVAHAPSACTVGAHGILDNGQIPKMSAEGVNVALASDGALGIRYALTLASTVHKDITLDASTLDAPYVLEMVTRYAARAALWEDEIGTLEVGKRADLVLVDRSSLRYEPDLEPVRAFVVSGQTADVQTVICDGRVLMRDRKLETIDEERLRHELRRMARAAPSNP